MEVWRVVVKRTSSPSVNMDSLAVNRPVPVVANCGCVNLALITALGHRAAVIDIWITTNTIISFPANISVGALLAKFKQPRALGYLLAEALVAWCRTLAAVRAAHTHSRVVSPRLAA